MSSAQPELQSTAVSGEARPGPTPERLFETLTAYQHTAALKAAIELDLFTGIGGGHDTAEALAKKVKVTERGARILCDILAVLGFLTKTDGRYALSADSALFLDKKSAAFAGSAKDFLANPLMIQEFSDVATVVRTGRPLGDSVVGIEHPIWVEFARSMAPLLHLPSMATAMLLDGESKMKVLDIAAGHGSFGIAIARRNPKAQIVALDFPAVLTVAHENATRAGLLPRYSLLAGDAFAVEFGSEFDAVLIPNFLHGFERDMNERLLKKVFDALSSKGRVIVVSFMPNDDRVSPRVPALFALMMLGNNLGDAYTVAEYRDMLRKAGFPECEAHPLRGTPFTAIVAVKP